MFDCNRQVSFCEASADVTMGTLSYEHNTKEGSCGTPVLSNKGTYVLGLHVGSTKDGHKPNVAIMLSHENYAPPSTNGLVELAQRLNL
jgi:V8-like Glu-specific endopeptidase